jgi:hypothetical protein
MFRYALSALCLMSSVTIASGSLWESPDWAVLGTLDGSVAYDSNLNLIHDGPSALLIVASPTLTLTRHNSETDFEINGGTTETEFADSNQPFETDISLGTHFSYPKADNTDPRGLIIIPIFELSGSWLKSSQPNEFLGARVQNDLTTVTADGYVTLTGKLGVRGSAKLQSITYDETSLNDTYSGEAAIGLAYERTPETQISLNIGTVLGHSKPNDPANSASDIRSKEFDITGRIQGQLTDKITGSAYGGFGVVSYTGGYTNTNRLPVAGADLTWGIDPRRTVVLAAYSGAEYSPNGEAADNSRAFISFTDVIIDNWQFIVRTGPSHNEYSRVVRLRTDNEWDYGMEFAYQPSTRFRVFLSLNVAQHTSTIAAYQYNHEVVTLGATYHL